MADKLQSKGLIPNKFIGLRLDQALAKIFPKYSRCQLAKLIKAEHVLIDNKIINSPSSSVNGGEYVLISAIIEVADNKWKAEDIQLDIIHEDNEVMIINKPADMVVHPGIGHHNGTLANALLNYLPGSKIIPRSGIVHRLDKGTTGLLMIAKTLKAHDSLTLQLREHTVLREYQAIAIGVLISGGTIKEPIGRHHFDRKRMTVTNSNRLSITHYRVEQRFKAHTHIQCRLETGRTHQIRVHMAHIAHPILGDPVYGSRFKFPKGITKKCRNAIKAFNRQALHASLLGFIHPKTRKKVFWKIDMPTDMRNMINILDKTQR
ncbi:MAG: 23S rRNA pseudouridine(1911/1915/1917) synthase RluD [Piscirickettsiaceae bacterium]|nr:23S rRNA pseudouridine(1911/1915/1917) synthase RluD [Piscirickettsiaceae bacterium]